jgi:hypothetical protein
VPMTMSKDVETGLTASKYDIDIVVGHTNAYVKQATMWGDSHVRVVVSWRNLVVKSK